MYFNHKSQLFTNLFKNIVYTFSSYNIYGTLTFLSGFKCLYKDRTLVYTKMVCIIQYLRTLTHPSGSNANIVWGVS